MAMPRAFSRLASLLLSLGLCGAAVGADEADLILHHGKIATVDRDFSIRQALAVKGDRMLRVGTDEEVLKTRGPRTEVVDLEGKLVLPA
jgi:predicted amidohydrolase YtcJ